MPSVFALDATDGRSREIEAIIQQRLCGMLPGIGDTAGALETCRESIRLLQPLSAQDPQNRVYKRMTAVSYGSLGNVLRATGRLDDALVAMKDAAGLFDELAAAEPTNADYLTQTANINLILAGALTQKGDVPAAIAAYEKTVGTYERLLPLQTDDSKARSVLASALARYSALLKQTGEASSARALMVRAFDVRRPIVDRPNVALTLLNDYADALNHAEYPELRDPRKALEIMLRVNRDTGGANPIFLDTLAWAYFGNHDTAMAIATERKALSLLPANQSSGLRSEIEKGLAEFEAARP
jgi:tetratricopeptide (TPR) repeat protein